jgi:pyruvate dehydrogenase E1 component alpha subunit
MADGYDMPNEQVDGMACEPVFDAIDRAVKRARKGEGPTLLEMRTYRYKGHSMSDPAKYRTKDELEKYKSLDPIENALQIIKENKYASESDLNDIQDKIKKQVEDSIKFADESDYPDASELYDDVYRQEDYPFLVD